MIIGRKDQISTIRKNSVLSFNVNILIIQTDTYLDTSKYFFLYLNVKHYFVAILYCLFNNNNSH